MEEELKKIKISTSDIITIDMKIANIIIQHTKGKFNFAGGCIISNTTKNYSSGGVIGNPNTPPKSAEGIFENIAKGYTMLSYPEGPGIIYKSNEEIDNYLLKVSNKVNLKIHLAEKISKYMIKNYKDDPFIIVCDGCNSIGGFIGVYDGNEYKYHKEIF